MGPLPSLEQGAAVLAPPGLVLQLPVSCSLLRWDSPPQGARSSPQRSQCHPMTHGPGRESTPASRGHSCGVMLTLGSVPPEAGGAGLS